MPSRAAGNGGRSSVRIFEASGRRKSALTTTTLRPVSAKAAARLTAIVVLPSAGLGEVTRIAPTRSSSASGCPPAAMNVIDVRRERKASAAALCSSGPTTRRAARCLRVSVGSSATTRGTERLFRLATIADLGVEPLDQQRDGGAEERPDAGGDGHSARPGARRREPTGLHLDRLRPLERGEVEGAGVLGDERTVRLVRRRVLADSGVSAGPRDRSRPRRTARRAGGWRSARPADRRSAGRGRGSPPPAAGRPPGRLVCRAWCSSSCRRER